MTTISKSKSNIYLLSAEEKKILCEDWQKTGLSRSVFIRERNLPPVFNHWCNQFLPKPEKSTANSTLSDDKWLKINAVKPISSMPMLDKQQLMEFGLTFNALKLNFSMPMEQVIHFIRGLHDATTII